MILHMLDASGGFLCGDTETGLTAYAYRTSAHANAAKRSAAKVASGMLSGEQAWMRSQPRIGAEIAAMDACRLAKLAARDAEICDHFAHALTVATLTREGVSP